jgi:hypothetical protein
MKFVEAVDKLTEEFYLSDLGARLLQLGIGGCAWEDIPKALSISIPTAVWLLEIDDLSANGLMACFGRYPNEICQTTEKGLEALQGYGYDV